MQERMTTGRLKVFVHCQDWFQEFRAYHRKDGLIVKTNDDLMSATRIWVMARRNARPLGGVLMPRGNGPGGGPPMCKDVDFDPFSI